MTVDKDLGIVSNKALQFLMTIRTPQPTEALVIVVRVLAVLAASNSIV